MADLEAAVEKARQKLESSMDSQTAAMLERRRVWYESGLPPEGKTGSDEELAACLLELERRLAEVEEQYKAELEKESGGDEHD